MGALEAIRMASRIDGSFVTSLAPNRHCARGTRRTCEWLALLAISAGSAGVGCQPSGTRSSATKAAVEWIEDGIKRGAKYAPCADYIREHGEFVLAQLNAARAPDLPRSQCVWVHPVRYLPYRYPIVLEVVALRSRGPCSYASLMLDGLEHARVPFPPDTSSALPRIAIVHVLVEVPEASTGAMNEYAARSPNLPVVHLPSVEAMSRLQVCVDSEAAELSVPVGPWSDYFED